MVMLGDEEKEDRSETLLLAMDTWSQRRFLKLLMEFEEEAAKMERSAATAEHRTACQKGRATAITLRVWLGGAIRPAGYLP